MVRIYLFSDDDAFLLHAAEVKESQFVRLREDEHLLVDFAGFAEKLVGLLERCAAAPGRTMPPSSAAHPSEQPGRFKLVLHLAGAGALLKVVECNDFKELPHLTLQLRPGTDAAVKHFLAFRLKEVQADCTQLQVQREALQGQCASLEVQLKESQAAAAATAEEHRATCAQQSTEAALLREKLRVAEEQATSLSARLTASEAACRSAVEEAQQLRHAHQQVFQSRSEQEVQLAEARRQLSAAEQSARTGEASAAQAREKAEGLTAALLQAEARLQDVKAVAAGYEAQAAAAGADASRAWHAAQRAESEARAVQEQLQERTAATARLQDELAAQCRAVEAALQREAVMTQQLEDSRNELGGWTFSCWMFVCFKGIWN